jgi:transglutaminase-like putative cysteine protease
MGDFATVPVPITEESVLEWLKPTTFVQSDDPGLVAKAQEIVEGATDSWEINQRLCSWVYDNMKTAFSARLTNAVEVLGNMEGDCTEHSILFIGLARAAGLPAREVAGLIYVGDQPGFYFHQWAKVWVGKWVDVDPTFDQPLADATHIKLAEGDLMEQAKLIPVIGRIRIEVVPDRKAQSAP